MNHKYRDPVERLHRERWERSPTVPDLSDPQLKAAYHSLQLHWLATVPGYKEILKKRVSDAAKEAEKLSRKIDRDHRDVDYLGREIDPCG